MENANGDMEKRDSLFNVINTHWRGEGSLSWAFWRFHFVGGLILLFSIFIVFLISLPFVYVENQSVLESEGFSVINAISVFHVQHPPLYA